MRRKEARKASRAFCSHNPRAEAHLPARTELPASRQGRQARPSPTPRPSPGILSIPEPTK